MNKKDQMKRVREADREREEMVRAMVTADLAGPKGKDVAAFLAELVRQAAQDPTIYRIDLLKFSSSQYYRDMCIDLECNVVSRVPGLQIRTHDSLQLIQLCFLNAEALKGFKVYLPLGFGTEDDTFEFIERKRHPKSRKWVLVTKPVMWEAQD